MRFYSEIKGNEVFIMGKKPIRFTDGEYETNDADEIAALKKFYRSDDCGETEQGDTEGQEVEAEQEEEEEISLDDMTYNQLKNLARGEGLVIGKKSRSALIEALEVKR